MYYCLLCICKYHAPLLVTTMLDEMKSILLETILTISVVSKKYRLKCLLYLARHFDPVVLCVKDSSRKIRAICIAIVTRFSDIMKESTLSYQREDGSQGHASLSEFIGLLTACLASQAPHMQAAAVLSLGAVLRHHRNEPEWDLVRELEPIMSHVMATGSENKNKFRLTVDVER